MAKGKYGILHTWTLFQQKGSTKKKNHTFGPRPQKKYDIFLKVGRFWPTLGATKARKPFPDVHLCGRVAELGPFSVLDCVLSYAGKIPSLSNPKKTHVFRPNAVFS